MRRRLIILFTLLCVVGTGIWSVATNHRAAKADSISTILSGSAYGLSVIATNSSTDLSGDPFGGVSAGCSPHPTNQENTTLGINLFHGLLTSTTMKSTLTFTHSDYLSTVEASSTIERLTIGQTLLAPLLEIDDLHAVAHSIARIGNATSDTSHSFFGVIRIAGIRLPLAIVPNVRIMVPGLGMIVLNEQITESLSPTNSYAEMNMLDITLGLGNVLGQPVGTRILIGHATSMDSAVSILAALQSQAFGLYTSLAVKGIVTAKVGPLPDTRIGCTGGTDYASEVILNTPFLVDGGVAETQTTGLVTSSQVSVSSYEKIADLSLLGGLIRVKTLQESAQATYDGSRGTRSGTFNLLGLYIGKRHILLGVQYPDIKIKLPGLGYVIIDERVPTSCTEGYAINALDIYITTPNALGLAVGLRIIVGHVDAGISVFH